MNRSAEARIRVILGKNGSGKSRYLRELKMTDRCAYIVPERGGTLVFNANTDGSAGKGQAALARKRQANQSNNFRLESVSLAVRLRLKVLLAFQDDTSKPKFTETMNAIQSLFENVKVSFPEKDFEFTSADSGESIDPKDLSSGESELVSLAIECLAFVQDLKEEPDGDSLLLLDEPDVHLHPDLQVRFMCFLTDLVDQLPNLKIVIATHSTALVAGLRDRNDVAVAFLCPDKEPEYQPLDRVTAKILPAFGAHPLTQVFNERPPLFVEGDDDERVWQQAVRSSQGRISVFPVVTASISQMNKYEKRADSILAAVYDNARAFSLRDNDEGSPELDDEGSVVRMRLNCKAAENLLLSDDTLSSLGTDWVSVCEGANSWSEGNKQHSKYGEVTQFFKQGADRQWADLKELRNLLLVFIDTSKSWETAVGQAIAKLTIDSHSDGHSLRTYLGQKVFEQLLGLEVDGPNGLCSSG